MFETPHDRGDMYFDPESAEKVVRFVEYLPLPGGEFSQTIKLFPWQHFAVTTMFGWMLRDTGRRRFRTMYLMTGRGSGKTPLAAALAIHHLFTYQSPDTDGWILAETADQAQIAMRYIVSCIRREPSLWERVRVVGGDVRPDKIVMVDPQGIATDRRLTRFTGSSTRGRGKAGFRPSFILAEEFQEHSDKGNYDLLVSGLKNRREPTVILTSNAGYGHATFAHREFDYASRVARGEVDAPSYLPLVYASDKDDKPFEDRACWIHANPSLPVTPGYEYLEEQVARGRTMPSDRSEVERVCFSRWQDAGEPGLMAQAFVNCECPELSSPESRRGVPCVLGLDLSASIDLTALVAVWDMDDRMEAEVTVYTPIETARARGEADDQPYLEYIEDGLLVGVPGAVMDYTGVVRDIAALVDRFDVRCLAFDRWNAAELVKVMGNEGLRFTKEEDQEGLWMVEHPQGWRGTPKDDDADDEGNARTLRPWMPRSWRSLVREVAQQTLRVRANPLLRTGTCGIVLARDPVGNAIPDRRRSLVRIDPGVALTMAVGTMSDYRRYKGKTGPIDPKNWII